MSMSIWSTIEGAVTNGNSNDSGHDTFGTF